MGQSRDAARTRRKIMDAALEEFAAKGLAGARVEAVAQRAGVQKQLLYHYFPSKEALFEQATQRAVREKLETATAAADLGAFMRGRFDLAARDPVLLRLLTWEALEYPETGRMVVEEERREAGRLQLEAIMAGQRRGALPADLEPRLLQLAVGALAVYPFVLRQITEMVTGRSPDDPEFQAEWGAFLLALGSRLSGTDTNEGGPPEHEDGSA